MLGNIIILGAALVILPGVATTQVQGAPETPGATEPATARAPGEPTRTMRGPLPGEQRDLIHWLAPEHARIEREVVFTDSGYVATTTSEDPELVAALHDHVAYMRARLDSGAMVRRWDPAFRELIEHHDDLVTTLVALDDGLEMHVAGRTPEAVLVAWNHASIVTGFVDDGEEAIRREHATTADRDRAPRANLTHAPATDGDPGADGPGDE